MKNIFLVLILIALIGIAYYSEEIYKAREKKELEVQEFQETSLFKSEAINFTGIKTPNYFLEFEKVWMVKTVNYPASEKLMQELRKIFSGIKIKGVIVDKNKDELFKYSSIPFSLLVGQNEYQYILGDVSSATGRFYVKKLGKEEQVYLCEDDSHLDAPYKNEVDLQVKKYLRLKGILQGQKDLLIQRALFKKLNIKKLTSIIIDNKRNRRFQVNIDKNVTEPSKIEGVKYKNFNSFLTTIFSKALIQTIHEQKQRILTDLSSELIFYHDSKKSIAKLYKGFNEKYGYYVKFENYSTIFEIQESAAEIFFLNVQDFWEKKIYTGLNLSQKDQFQFELSLNGQKFYLFEVKDLTKFKIESVSKEVEAFDQTLMNMLFNIIFNLVDFREARYIDTFSQISEAKGCLEVKSFKKHLMVCLEEKQIIVYDRTKSLKHIFNYSTKNVGVQDWSDIFTLRAK